MISSQAVGPADSVLPGSGAPSGRLTPHERRVVSMLAEGRSYLEMAENFGVTVNTMQLYPQQLQEAGRPHQVRGSQQSDAGPADYLHPASDPQACQGTAPRSRPSSASPTTAPSVQAAAGAGVSRRGGAGRDRLRSPAPYKLHGCHAPVDLGVFRVAHGSFGPVLVHEVHIRFGSQLWRDPLEDCACRRVLQA